MWIVDERRYAKSFLPEETEKGKPRSLAWPSGRLRLVRAGLIAANLLWVPAGAEATAAKPVLIVPATKNAEHKVSPYTRANIQRAEALKATQSRAAALGQRPPRLAGQIQR